MRLKLILVSVMLTAVTWVVAAQPQTISAAAGVETSAVQNTVPTHPDQTGVVRQRCSYTTGWTEDGLPLVRSLPCSMAPNVMIRQATYSRYMRDDYRWYR